MKKLFVLLPLCVAAFTVSAAEETKADWMNRLQTKIEAKGKTFNTKWAENLFKKIDTDGSGTLTWAEKKAASKK